MRAWYPEDIDKIPGMREAWDRMLAYSDFLRRQPRDENGDTIVIRGRENPSWYPAR